MDAAIRDKWAAMLESGRYIQGIGALRQGSAFCCLGVLCELFREQTGEGEWEERGRVSREAAYRFRARGTSNIEELPAAVRDWAGLPDSNPWLQRGGYEGTAIYLNDFRLDFKGIAKLIRQLPATEA